MHRYSEEQKEFIITNNYGKYSKELADTISAKKVLGVDYSYEFDILTLI